MVSKILTKERIIKELYSKGYGPFIFYYKLPFNSIEETEKVLIKFIGEDIWDALSNKYRRIEKHIDVGKFVEHYCKQYLEGEARDKVVEYLEKKKESISNRLEEP